MKIIGLHIFGYGKFHDYKLDSIQDFQVFYGENEAGKSTLMSFIHSMLFGFPTKQQAALRYEPKTHGQYGGRLILDTGKTGVVKIERVRGRAAGDVTVLLEDGTVGGEELLAKLLGGMDKTMYQNVFSFNLDGLQNVQRMKDDEIAKYLIAAGTVGTDRLLQLENELEKEMELLFKPNGRKPELNVQLKEIRDFEKKVKEAKSHNGRYHSLSQHKKELQKEIDEIREDIRRLTDEKDHAAEWKKRWPVIQERKEVTDRLANLEEVRFPEDGLRRYEKDADIKINTTIRIAGLEERMETIREQLNDDQMLGQPFVLRAEKLLTEWPMHLQEYEEWRNLQKELEEIEKRITWICRELHLADTDSLKAANISLDQKVKLKTIVRRYERLALEAEQLQAQLEKEKMELDILERECSRIEEQLLPEQEWRDLKRKFERMQSMEKLELEQRFLEESLLQAKLSGKREKQQKRRLSAAFASIVLLGFVLLFVLDGAGKWAGLAMIAVTLLSSFLVLRNKDPLAHSEIKEKLAQLNAEIEKLSLDQAPIQKMYEQAAHAREQWKESFSRLSEIEERTQLLSVELAEKKKGLAAADHELALMKSEVGLQPDFSNEKLEEAFEYVKELVLAKDRQALIESRVSALAEGLAKRSADVAHLADSAGVHGVDDNEKILLLKAAIRKDQEKESEAKGLKKRWAEMEEEKDVLLKERNAADVRIGKLWEGAGAANEEEFRRQARLSAEKTRLEERLSLLMNQAGADWLATLPDNQTSDKLEKTIKELGESIEAKSSLVAERIDQLAAVNYEMQAIEDGGSYADRLHLYQQRLSKFNEDAKRWAELAAAKALLQETMAVYKKERLPKVMEMAEEYMAILTDSEYRKIHLQQDGHLFVERHDGMLFAPGELSRGTGEQLYTALRLALANMLYSEYRLPVIVDDGFVNFDRNRAAKVLELLERVSGKMQVLFFTCQEHLAVPFTPNTVITLDRSSGVKVPVN